MLIPAAPSLGFCPLRLAFASGSDATRSACSGSRCPALVLPRLSRMATLSSCSRSWPSSPSGTSLLHPALSGLLRGMLLRAGCPVAVSPLPTLWHSPEPELMGGGAGPAVLSPDEAPADGAQAPIDLVSDTSESRAVQVILITPVMSLSWSPLTKQR